MAKLERMVVIEKITPAELAAIFCDMFADEQAAFFSEIGRIAANWPGTGWCGQSCAISDNLDQRAIETIAKLAEWAAEPYRKPEGTR